MNMTNDEIVRNFKNAANPRQQVQILAELNGTNQETIKRILTENGVDHRQLPRQKPAKKTAPTPGIMGALQREEETLLARREAIIAEIPALEAELETITEKLEAVKSAKAALAVVYGGGERGETT